MKKPLNEEELDKTAGGTGSQQDSETRTPDGVCPGCGRTRYRVVRTVYTENGPSVHEYYECVMCGILN